MPYRSASSGGDSASNVSLYMPTSRGAAPRPRRGQSSRDDGAPPLPAFPEAYRRSPASSSIGGGISRSATPGGTLRSGNVMIHSDAGMLMDDRLSDDDDGADQGELLELPPQYASLPARANSTAGRSGGPSGRTGAAAVAGRHDSGAQTLSAAAGAPRASAPRNRPRGPTGDQKENEEAGLPSSMMGSTGAAQDPFAEQTTPGRTQGRRTGAGGDASDEETEEDAAQRAERGGTLDRFVGDEDDDAFWLPRGAG